MIANIEVGHNSVSCFILNIAFKIFRVHIELKFKSRALAMNSYVGKLSF